jgi:hypothetical protein
VSAVNGFSAQGDTYDSQRAVVLANSLNARGMPQVFSDAGGRPMKLLASKETSGRPSVSTRKTTESSLATAVSVDSKVSWRTWELRRDLVSMTPPWRKRTDSPPLPQVTPSRMTE